MVGHWSPDALACDQAQSLKPDQAFVRGGLGDVQDSCEVDVRAAGEPLHELEEFTLFGRGHTFPIWPGALWRFARPLAFIPTRAFAALGNAIRIRQ